MKISGRRHGSWQMGSALLTSQGHHISRTGFGVFARQVDDWIALAKASAPHMDRLNANVRAHLERLAEPVEGWVRPGLKADERIFGLPAWLLVDRVRLTHRKPGTCITEAQEFLVDDTVIRWLRHEHELQNFGGKYVLRIGIDDFSVDEQAGGRPFGGWVSNSSTARRIVANGHDHWQGFVTAARSTRVFRAMERIGRDDLRVALWLSRRVWLHQRGGGYKFEFRHLQFAENHPELAAQILPLPSGDT